MTLEQILEDIKNDRVKKIILDSDIAIEMDDQYALAYCLGSEKIQLLSANGGTFGKGGSNVARKPWLQTADNGTSTIYGGSFEFDPSAFVAEGYEAIKGANGWWTVSKIDG